MIHTIKWLTQLNYKCSCLLCPCRRCVQRGHKIHNRRAANNAGQPCPLLARQIHRISRGTAPWTTDHNRLQGARLWLHHHQSQRGGPPSRGQGTQQRQDGLPWHTRERHCILPAMNDRTSSQQITTCTYMHGSYIYTPHTYVHYKYITA